MKKQKDKRKVIIVLIVILLCIVIILSILIKKINKNTNQQEKNKVETRTEEQKENEKIDKLKKSTEAERIKTYIGTYFKYIEQKNLSAAYELLYPDFRNNYFKTEEEFEKYMKDKSYPELMAINYKTISTQGKYYLVTIEITDMLNNDKTIYSEDLTLIEEDYNVFYISFKI